MNTAGAPLKDFQQDTVDYVLERLYDAPNPTDRFLVADEVGMGKTLVARGVIEGAVERMQEDDSVNRIDIIYICSNSAIAAQNISKLNETVADATPLSTRISMLATQLTDLNRAMADGSKTINFVAITPGTSFSHGQRGGRVEERALLYWLLKPRFPTGRQLSALSLILQLDVGGEKWRWRRDDVGVGAQPDSTVVGKFNALLDAPESGALVEDLHEFVLEMAGRRKLQAEETSRARDIIGRLRRILAKSSVDALEPDLVILDEFQRFKQLLNDPKTDAEREVRKLADALFEARTAKVLLLSASPYKAYTLAEEKDDDDHYSDFIETIKFLEGKREPLVTPALRRSLAELRSCATSESDTEPSTRAIEEMLRPLMCRTERPVLGDADMREKITNSMHPPSAEDMLGYVAMRRIAKEVNGSLSVDYWKSAPYFLNFMDGYKLSEQFKAHVFDSGTRGRLLRHAQVIGREVEDDDPIDPGNSRLRQLEKETLDADMWKLLWLPPSMPYHESSGAYEDVDSARVTKRLIFSSWAAAPTAISSLLSHEASRRARNLSDRDGPAEPLLYAIDANGRAGAMTTLALFAPTPTLALATDPLELARQTPDVLPSLSSSKDFASAAAARLVDKPGEPAPNLSRDSWYWAAPFTIDSAASRIALDQSGEDGQDGFHAHLRRVEALEHERLGPQPDDLDEWVGLIGLAGPANVAWRALHRVTLDKFSESAVLNAAACIGSGFRSLFRHEEVVSVVSHFAPHLPYWKAVLRYCHAGNLQAVMDEYLHHVFGQANPTDEDELLKLAEEIRDTLGLRAATNRAFDPSGSEESIAFNTRFALRYGSGRSAVNNSDSAVRRSVGVRSAFNSPFWPMVLASTSVGQEGIDFHWWCHSIVHWNLPANPADVEQREGRVNRFKGHAVRKNVARAHRAQALAAGGANPWEGAFAAADETRPTGMSEIWPSWAYPGESKIQRWIASYPLSKDEVRESRILHEVELYRLVFGQPRQEEMLQILSQQNVAEQPERAARMMIDLSPPKRQR